MSQKEELRSKEEKISGLEEKVKKIPLLEEKVASLTVQIVDLQTSLSSRQTAAAASAAGVHLIPQHPATTSFIPMSFPQPFPPQNTPRMDSEHASVKRGKRSVSSVNEDSLKKYPLLHAQLHSAASSAAAAAAAAVNHTDHNSSQQHHYPPSHSPSILDVARSRLHTNPQTSQELRVLSR